MSGLCLLALVAKEEERNRLGPVVYKYSDVPDRKDSVPFEQTDPRLKIIYSNTASLYISLAINMAQFDAEHN